MDYFGFDGVDEAELRREKARAREMRKTRWWQQKTSSGMCYYCGAVVGPKELTMDHLVPLAMGGRSNRSNLVPSCKVCNTKKKTMMPIEWDDFLQKTIRGKEDP